METAIGIQPILDKDLNIYGYEILFRGKFKDNKFNDIVATFHNLNILLNSYNLQSIIGDKKGFLNVNEEILKSDILCLLNPDKFVLEVLETTDIGSVVDEIKGFKEKGFLIALDDFVVCYENCQKAKEYMNLFDIIKVDVLETDFEWLKNNLSIFDGKILLAEKVEDKDTFEKYKDLGFKLYQGFFFEKPDVRKKKISIADKTTIFKLLSKNSIDEIEKGIKSDPRLAVNLLKFVNSAFFARKHRIESVRKAVISLGLSNIKRWLVLSLYIPDGTDITKDALVDTVKKRSVLMSLLAKKLRLNEEKAFLVGALSLIDVITDDKVEDILRLINADEDVKDAILNKRGIYYKLLELTVSAEKNEPITEKLQELKLSEEDFEKIYIQAIRDSVL